MSPNAHTRTNWPSANVIQNAPASLISLGRVKKESRRVRISRTASTTKGGYFSAATQLYFCTVDHQLQRSCAINLKQFSDDLSILYNCKFVNMARLAIHCTLTFSPQVTPVTSISSDHS